MKFHTLSARLFHSAKRCTPTLFTLLTICHSQFATEDSSWPRSNWYYIGLSPHRRGSSLLSHAVTGTVVALITSLPTYCRFHGLAMTKFVRSHHPPCDSVGSLRRSCRNNSQSCSISGLSRKGPSSSWFITRILPDQSPFTPIGTHWSTRGFLDVREVWVFWHSQTNRR